MEENKEIEKNIDEEIEATEEVAEEIVEEASENDVKAELEKSVKELNDRLLRNMAEFDNFRKRTIAEKAGMYDNGVKDTVEKLLPVIDNFERAVNAVSDEDKDGNFYKGVEMIFKQFLDILDNMGVEEIAGEGEDFDPNVHNAVMHVEDDSFGENKVAEVLQKGYKYNDKVIRPSMVKVAN